MKKYLSYLIVSLIVLSSLSFVSAGLLDIFKGQIITGNVIADQTTYSDVSGCSDSDGGVISDVAGVVVAKSSQWLPAKGHPDICTGKAKTYLMSDGTKVIGYAQIKETYCVNGKQVQTMNSSNLGEGYCVKETVTIDEKDFKSAKWVLLEKTCVNLRNEKGVKDQGNKEYKNNCKGNTYTSYSCDASNNVVTQTQDCSLLSYGKCTTNGCSSKDCSDTDVNNSKDISGVVTANGTSYPDTCNPRKTEVKQYQCDSNGKAKVIGEGYESCGTNRECVVDTVNGDYCRDKYLGAETLETLTAKISELESTIASLTQRIEALENPTAIGYA